MQLSLYISILSVIQELGYTGMQFTFIWMHRPIESCAVHLLYIGGLSRRSAVWADGSCSHLPSQIIFRPTQLLACMLSSPCDRASISVCIYQDLFGTIRLEGAVLYNLETFSACPQCMAFTSFETGLIVSLCSLYWVGSSWPSPTSPTMEGYGLRCDSGLCCYWAVSLDGLQESQRLVHASHHISCVMKGCLVSLCNLSWLILHFCKTDVLAAFEPVMGQGGA